MALKALPLPLKLPAFNEMLQWHRHRDADPALAWLRERLHEAAAGFRA
jgi:DNA-binding transcriptional LysR family regulator